MKVKNIISTHGRDIAFVILLIISLAVLVDIFVLALKYSSGTEDEAILMAGIYSEDATNGFTNEIDDLREKTNALAAGIANNSEDAEKINYYLNSIMRSEGYKDEGIQEIWYFLDNKVYTSRDRDNDYRGDLVNDDDRRREYILDMQKAGVLATRGFFYDNRGEAPCVACYCPVPTVSSDEVKVDGVVVFYPQSTVMSFKNGLDEEKLSRSKFQALCCETESSDPSVTRVLGI
ncbi:MAG: hypothetical protein J5781_07115, partial [Clostridia bacterium]|nr:hypothetical protein [Clostridia bacterium]